MMGGGQKWADRWAAARPQARKTLHAEDGAFYQTELNGNVALKIAVYGCKKGPNDRTGSSINLCKDCVNMARTLGVPAYSDSTNMEDDDQTYQAEQLYKRVAAKKTTPKTSAPETTVSTVAAATSTTSVKVTSCAKSTSTGKVQSASLISSTSRVISSGLTSATASSSSQVPSTYPSSGQKTSTASNEATGGISSTVPSAFVTVTSVKKLVAVPFTISLFDQPEFDGTGAATVTATSATTLQTSSSALTSSLARL